MDRSFSPMSDNNYIEGFTEHLIKAYRHRREMGSIHAAEETVLDLLEVPGVNNVPLVWHDQTLVVSMDESRALNLAGFIDDIHHGTPAVTIPVILPIEEWRGEGSRSFAASLNWFQNYITARSFAGSTATVFYRPATISCSAAAIIASAPGGVSVSQEMVGSMASISHDELHEANAFPRNHDDEATGDILQQVSDFLRGKKG